MRPGPAWIPGVIIQQMCPLSYLVDVHGEKPWKCHVDQLKELMGESEVIPVEVSPQLEPMKYLYQKIITWSHPYPCNLMS